MKRLITLMASALLILSLTTGCTAEGKAFLDNYQAAANYQIIEQESTTHMEFQLKNVLDAMMTLATGHDREALKFMYLVEKHPTVHLKTTFKSYADVQDVNDIQMHTKMSLALHALGKRYQFNNLDIYLKDDTLYVDKRLLTFALDTSLSIADKVGIDIEVLAADVTQMIKELDADYITFDLSADTMPTVLQQQSITQDEMLKNYMVLLKAIDVNVPIVESDGYYRLSLNAEQCFNLLEKTVAAMATDREKLAPLVEEFFGVDDFAESIVDVNTYLSSDAGKEQLETEKLYFEGTTVSLYNRLRNQRYDTGMALDLNLMHRHLLSFKSEQASWQTIKRELSYPVANNTIEFTTLNGQIDALRAESGASMQGLPYDYIPDLTGRAQTVTVNGKSYLLNSYEIYGKVCYNLEDIAIILDGSSAQFNIMRDAYDEHIAIIPERPYAGATRALSPIDSTADQFAETSSARMTLSETPIQPYLFEIDESHYVALIDLAPHLNIDVTWDEADRIHHIKTK